MTDDSALVTMSGIAKRYGGVQACAGIDLSIRPGEVHALLGENGAGKSTLMKILSGDITDYEGRVDVGGRISRFSGPTDAHAAGIAMIHQELDLVPGLSVADNIFLGREPRTRFRTVDRRRTAREARALLERGGVNLDIGRAVGELRVGEQQLVTIAKAISLDARVLIMDEPTSALSSTEVERLFTVIRGRDRLHLAPDGGDRPDRRSGDRAPQRRRGRAVRHRPAEHRRGGRGDGRPTAAEHVQHREHRYRRRAAHRRGPAAPAPAAPSRPARPGGDHADGPGRRDRRTGRAARLRAYRTARSGSITLGGRRIRPRGARHALKQGIGFVPEDRRASGLVLFHSVLANTVVSSLRSLGAAGVVQRGRERRAASQVGQRLRTKYHRLGDEVGTLSGGNQQKVVFGRMMLTKPRLLLLDEPTRGVDVGAKAEIYRLLGELAADGLGVLLASSELPELVGVCDRVVVLRDGRTVGEFSTTDAGEGDLLAAAMGQGTELETAVTGGDA